MNTIYIGDRKLEPDEEWDCPFCGNISSTQAGLMLHVSRCPKNDDIEKLDDPAEEV